MVRIKGPGKVHRSSAEFKLKAVQLSQIEGVHVHGVAATLNSGVGGRRGAILGAKRNFERGKTIWRVGWLS